MGAFFKKRTVTAYCRNCHNLWTGHWIFDGIADLRAGDKCPDCGNTLTSPDPDGTKGISFYESRLFKFRLRDGWLSIILIWLPTLLFGSLGMGCLTILVLNIIRNTVLGIEAAANRLYGLDGILRSLGGFWLQLIGMLSSIYFGILLAVRIAESIAKARRDRRGSRDTD